MCLEEVELGVIVSLARFVPSVVEQCGQKGCRGLIIISAGFREAGRRGAEDGAADRSDRRPLQHAGDRP